VLAASFGIAPAVAESGSLKKHSMQNHDTMGHHQMKNGEMKTGVQITRGETGMLPKEPGQGAFATIAEIVVILTNDPTTDWSKVDIERLREHLIDMDEISMRASSKTIFHDEKVVFAVTGVGRTLQAIQEMVPVHSEVLSRTTAWDVESNLTDTGATMTIRSNNPSILKVVKALGFFGVMATGAHHQAHHLSMAKGDDHVHKHN
jgi:hypothetical protein